MRVSKGEKVKPKQYLLSIGALKEITRGRLSREHIDLCKEAAAKGISIEGYSVNDSGTRPVVVKEPPRDHSAVLDVPDAVRDESAWEAFAETPDGLKPVGIKTVCNACGNSLPYCRDQHPRVWLDFDREGVVVFKPARKRK